VLEELGWKCKGTCIAIKKALQGFEYNLAWIGLDALQMRGVTYL
jgi:hypothetical protein